MKNQEKHLIQVKSESGEILKSGLVVKLSASVLPPENN